MAVDSEPGVDSNAPKRAPGIIAAKVESDEDGYDGGGGGYDVTAGDGGTGGGNESNNRHRTSRLGRKGDPRMHRAVAARLSNPDMSPLDALR